MQSVATFFGGGADVTIGMVVFWTGQTIAFSLYSQHGHPAAGHTVIAMICTFRRYFRGNTPDPICAWTA